MEEQSSKCHTFINSMKNFITNQQRLSIKRAVSNLKIPHLIIHGEADTSVSISEAENLHHWNPKSQYKVIKGANHVFNTRHPWETNTLSEALKTAVDSIITFIKTAL